MVYHLHAWKGGKTERSLLHIIYHAEPLEEQSCGVVQLPVHIQLQSLGLAAESIEMLARAYIFGVAFFELHRKEEL